VPKIAKKTNRTRIQAARLFKNLVENGFDFLKKAVAEIKKSPKYSVINFCAAVELFLKARLLREHWSLILTKPEVAELARFKAGDFVSVSMEEAIRRLDSVCDEKISSEAKEAFRATRNHRNNLVHFVHPAYAKASRRNLEKIVQEVCRAWFYLHQLITLEWRDEFKSYQNEIVKINKRMHGLRQFLNAKFEALQPQIAAEIRLGHQFEKCAVCGFKAAGIDEVGEPLHESKCKVCDAERRFLIADCPKCKRPVWINEMAEGQCSRCRYEIDINDLVEFFGDSHDPQAASTVAYCSSALGPMHRLRFHMVMDIFAYRV
jgi:hypothetical protein